MPDREKVILKLQYALEDAEEDGKIYAEIRRPILFDAISMLKEQEELLHRKQKDIDRLCAEISELKHKIHDDVLKEPEIEWCERCGRRRLKSSRVVK